MARKPSTDPLMTDPLTRRPFRNSTQKPWSVVGEAGISRDLALTFTIFLRRNFGEDYLKPISLFKGAVALALYGVAMRFYAGRGSIAGTGPVPWVSLATWVGYASCFLLYGSWQVFRTAGRSYGYPGEISGSDGIPRTLFLKLCPGLRDEWDFEFFYEPGLCLLLGVSLVYFGNWFGPYLILTGVTAYYVTWAKQVARRDKEASVRDSKGEMDDPLMSEVVETNTTASNAGKRSDSAIKVFGEEKKR